MKKGPDQKIIDSWNKNVQPWITAIEEHQIKSRIQLTNSAIINLIQEINPSSILDIGCGEGWLVRALHELGIDTFGIDVVPEFINHSNKIGIGQFKCIAYEDLLDAKFEKKFDLLVCNFSLLGKESVEQVFKSAPLLLKKGGSFVVQTVHPITSCGEEPYKDGWRTGSWDGFNKQFSDPAPWFFRTIKGWKLLFKNNGFTLEKSDQYTSNIIEPKYCEMEKPGSIIFVGTLFS